MEEDTNETNCCDVKLFKLVYDTEIKTELLVPADNLYCCFCGRPVL